MNSAGPPPLQEDVAVSCGSSVVSVCGICGVVVLYKTLSDEDKLRLESPILCCVIVPHC